ASEELDTLEVALDLGDLGRLERSGPIVAELLGAAQANRPPRRIDCLERLLLAVVPHEGGQPFAGRGLEDREGFERRGIVLCPRAVAPLVLVEHAEGDEVLRPVVLGCKGDLLAEQPAPSMAGLI